MTRRLDIENVDAALKRAAYKAVHGTREERAGRYQRVESTMMTSVRYDTDSHELRVAFKSGSMYCYQNVPLEIYLALLDAASKGRFFNEYVKDHFPATEISRGRRR
jgi:hypothetical protein